MIGNFNIDEPKIDDDLSQMVETHRAKTGQDYGAILYFGLWGTADCSAAVRLYAGYRHLAESPEDGAAWLEVSRAHLEEGEFYKAELILDELIRLGCPGIYTQIYSEDPEIHRAYIRAEEGRLDAALELMDNLKAKHDESPVYHFFIGGILHESGDLLGATAEYRMALNALETFRQEMEEEELDLEEGIDFDAANRYIEEFLRSAENGEIMIADSRPFDLADLREE